MFYETTTDVDDVTSQVRQLVTGGTPMDGESSATLNSLASELFEVTGERDGLEPIWLLPWQQGIWCMFGHDGQRGWEALTPAAQRAWLEFGPCR